MKYILKYYTEGRYLHFVRENIKEFETLPELRIFLIDNYKRITDYKIYQLKFNSKL